jgi:hypothetical protein
MAVNSAPSPIPKKSVKDFKFIKEIGNGSYSTVRRIGKNKLNFPCHLGLSCY